MWYVYFLQLRNGDIYVGSTNDLRRRLVAHHRGQVNSTKTNLPVKLKSYVAVSTEKIVRELERYFKSGSGKAFAAKRFGSRVWVYVPETGSPQTAPTTRYSPVPVGPLLPALPAPSSFRWHYW